MQITDLGGHAGAFGMDPEEQFAQDVLIGLCASPKRIPAKYFYDDKGSEIFQQITLLEEYYPARAELDILRQARDRLPQLIGEERIDIIELGPGDGSKSRIIIEGFLNAGCEVCYYPVDISARALDLLANNLPVHQGLAVHGVIAEYLSGLRFARGRSVNRQLVLFLGSNIGNFDRLQGQAFLHRIWKSMREGDHLMVGFDLKKDITTLTRAYNDSRGLTAAFNLNLLRRINDELGGNFDLERFEHLGIYNPVLGAMESYLISQCPQEIHISDLKRSFRFEAYEPLHLEYSFKFLDEDIEYLAGETGFLLEANFHGERHEFVDSLWRVTKR